jgi:hypothetical protein
LAAQAAAVNGVITDSASSQPLPGVLLQLVQLEDLSDTLVASTDDAGRFRLAGLSAGAYRLLVTHAGYEQREHEFELVGGEALELPRHMLWLVPTPAAELPGVQVTGDRVPVMMRPFYARRQLGFGHFLVQEDVESKNPKNTYDVLRGIPGIMVRPNPSYGIGGNSQRYLVENLRMATLNACPMLVFLNGVKIGPSNTVDIDFLVSPNNVGAVEVYATVAGLPAQFNVPGAACGVIVFWTRFGERN